MERIERRDGAGVEGCLASETAKALTDISDKHSGHWNSCPVRVWMSDRTPAVPYTRRTPNCRRV